MNFGRKNLHGTLHIVEGKISRLRPGAFDCFGDKWGVWNGCQAKM
jgi:hypothetical protein